MEKIVVIGTGTMAVGIGAGFINAGMAVVFLGRSLDKAATVLADAEKLAATLDRVEGLAPGAGSAGLIDSWNDWPGVNWVIETVAENFELKRELFAALDARVPAHIPIGTNSSGFPITRITEGLATRSRMFNAHYFMPAHLVPLVEVALGEDSDPALAEKVCELYRRAGKKPVLVRRDIPGFLANRIQHALMREALALIDSGIASPEDVDTAVRYSFGFRYAAAGPVLQKEISGWDSMARAAQEIYPSLSNTHVLADCVAGIIAAGKTGMKAGAGFVEWPPERAKAERAAYEKRLQAAFRVLSMD
ncbi:3-hydroxyacyl-CoA dehydrogenase NAD-binding domain-containing protein [Lacisediminimonas profundi]|uniref:3-hydroxyacyl-CoA dehydrogenase NAD-binding domain-containing protein n=1 Tax=Lacisediminimonas profundi TaxID=2603856 RepID=UPI0019D688AC|nr:3-hydroxyacyl-CoA dehydrogenase NAD-binding domain-containing protein [Lacisediminimonas profundi]